MKHYEEAFEEVALNDLQNHCKEHPKHRQVIYVHPKGSFHPRPAQNYWRKEGTMVASSEDCAKKLQEGQCNACGARVSFMPLHFSGNFWRASCDYVKLLPPVMEIESLFAEAYHTAPTDMNFTLEIKGQAQLGLGRFAVEQWIASHPSFTPCLNNMKGRHFGPPRGRAKDMWNAIKDNTAARHSEFFLLPGILWRFAAVNNDTTFPPEDSWLWDYFPDGREYRDAVQSLGSVKGAVLQAMMATPVPEELPSKTTTGTTNTTTSTTSTATSSALKATPPRNLHLAMVGDSLTRYQYIALVHYLQRRGEWIQNSEMPNFIMERTFKDHGKWAGFYNATNNLGGNSQCDCFRKADPGNSEWHQFVYENRYYMDTQLNNSVTFINKNGRLDATGHWEAPFDIQHPPTESDFLNGNFNFSWRYDWNNTIRNHIAKLEPKPKYVVINAGHWKHDLGSIHVLRGIRKALDDTGIVGIYKTTTAGQKETVGNSKPKRHDFEACKVLHYCYNVSWTAEVPEDQYWDGLHFLARTYQRLNEQLFGLIEEIEGGLAATSR